MDLVEKRVLIEEKLSELLPSSIDAKEYLDLSVELWEYIYEKRRADREAAQDTILGKTEIIEDDDFVISGRNLN